MGQRLISPTQTWLTSAPGPWRDKSCSWLCCPRPRLSPVPPARLTACVCCPDKPEILRAGARYQEVEGAGLLLVLFVLVQANPPASITWVDQDGHVVANASEFLLLGATRYPGLANHSLRVHLGSAAGNFSVSAANSVGVTTASLMPPGRCRGGGHEAAALWRGAEGAALPVQVCWMPAWSCPSWVLPSEPPWPWAPC